MTTTVWPYCVPVTYRGEESRPALQVLGAAVILVLITAAVVLWGRRTRYLVTGWAWYVLTLLPVVGVVRLAGTGVADRYMYVPHIGLFILVAWGVPDLLKGVPRSRIAVGCGELCGAVVLRTFRGDRHPEPRRLGRRISPSATGRAQQTDPSSLRSSG